MIVEKCDVCGRDAQRYTLSELHDEYRPSGVKDVCRDCFNDIHRLVMKLDKVYVEFKGSFVRRFIIKQLDRFKSAS